MIALWSAVEEWADDEVEDRSFSKKREYPRSQTAW